MFKRQRVLEILREQGRKRTWLAEKLDVSYDTITRYLKGDTEPTKSTAMAFAVYLQVDPKETWESDQEKAS